MRRGKGIGLLFFLVAIRAIMAVEGAVSGIPMAAMLR
jgi:hypothetical protein